jgi:hypothetical protein
MIPPLFGKQEVGIWRVQKRFPRYGVPIWSLWPNIRFLPSIVAEKNMTKNEHICSISCRYAILWEAFLDPSDSYFLFADLVGFYTHWTYMHSRQTGSRNLMGPKTLPTIWGTYMKLVTKYQISAFNSCWEKCEEKCAYMFNVYRNQLSRHVRFLLPVCRRAGVS